MTHPTNHSTGRRIARRAVLALVFGPLALACSSETGRNPLAPSAAMDRGEAESSAEMKDGVSAFSGTLQGVSHAIYDPSTNSNRVHLVGTAIVGKHKSFAVVADFVVALATEKSVGTLTLTARNGDVITATFTGQSHLVAPGVIGIVENATITGGTGRFTGATGSFVVNRTLTRATGVTTGSFAGSIALAGREREEE